jgi:hypothetical protein
MYAYIVKLFLKLYNGTSVIRPGIDYVLSAFLAGETWLVKYIGTHQGSGSP